MLAKLYKAFDILRQDVAALKGDVQRVEKVRQVVRHGVDGKSPDPDEIIVAVLERIPAPKDGISPDPEVIAEAAAKLIPEPKPGRDAVPPTVRDIVDVVLANITRPKDGISPDPVAIAASAAKLIPAPKDGKSPTAEAVAKKMPNPQRGKTGAPGKNGTSVTDVQLNNNELIVFLDGKKKTAGKIKMPAAPFRPGVGAGGGGGSTRRDIYTPPTRETVINSKGDFPKPVAGVITLVARTSYFIGDDVDIGTDGLNVSAGGISFRSYGFFVGARLTYTGTGDMFTGVDATLEIDGVGITCPNGQVYNITNPTTPNTVNLDVSSVLYIDIKKFGTVQDLNALIMMECASVNIQEGLTFLGTSTWRAVRIQNHGMQTGSATFVGYDLGDIVVELLTLTTLLFIGVPGAVGVSGLPNSGNVAPGSLADFANSIYTGGMTALAGITSQDVRWKFTGNNLIQDTMPGALLSLNGNATVTVITDN